MSFLVHSDLLLLLGLQLLYGYAIYLHRGVFRYLDLERSQRVETPQTRDTAYFGGCLLASLLSCSLLLSQVDLFLDLSFIQ